MAAAERVRYSAGRLLWLPPIETLSLWYRLVQASTTSFKLNFPAQPQCKTTCQCKHSAQLLPNCLPDS